MAEESRDRRSQATRIIRRIEPEPEKASHVVSIKKWKKRQLGKAVIDSIAHSGAVKVLEAAAAPTAALGLAATAGYAILKTAHETAGREKAKEEYQDILSRTEKGVSGKITFTRDFELRTSTSIDDKNPKGNIISPDNIDTINGTDVKNFGAAEILDAPIVERRSPNYPNISEWIFVIAGINDLGIRRNAVLYGNIDSFSGAVKRDPAAHTVPLKNLDKDNVGKVTLLRKK